MRVLVAWADESSPNLGVRVLGQGSCDLLRRVWPEAEFEYMNYGSRPPAVPWGPRSLIKERVMSRTGMMRWLSQFDVVWDTRSGDSFADIYGAQRHQTMSLIHEFAVQAGIPVVIAPQTIGPFHSRAARILARRNLRRSSLVFARDDASSEEAARLGRPVDLTTTDMVFGLRPPQAAVAHDVLLNVSGLLWNPNRHVDHQKYRRSIHALIAELRLRHREITLLPHVLDSPDPDNDVPVAQTLREEYGDAIGLHVPTDLADARGVIASSNVVIGARMHACLNALSTATPAIAMSYSRKFRPLLSALGWEHVISLSEGSDPAGAVLDALEDVDLIDRAARAQKEGQRRLSEMLPLISGLA